MLNSFLRKINPKIKSQSLLYWKLREWFVICAITFKRFFDRPKKSKKRILFFYVYALAYGGTSSLMQVFAKSLDKEKYEVFIMYSSKMPASTGTSIPSNSRLSFVQEGGVIPLPFDYSEIEPYQPNFIKGMSPSIYKIIKDFEIDLLAVTGAGNAEFPFSTIKNIPIIMFNIFGEANMQKNIKYHLCISDEVANKLSPVVPKEKIKVVYVPSEGPIDMKEAGRKIRSSLGIAETDIVFGRIGRNTDSIFDPIGIEAFKRVVKKFPDIHYIIVGAAPVLVEMQKREQIPNVHFLPEIGTKEGLWAFYYAIDVLAHFRHDGESFGLNIAEAMYAERPIISHKSHYWNAHLEYLEPAFSFVAEADNVGQYVQAMEFFAADKHKEKIHTMGKAAAEKAAMFHIKNFSPMFEELIEKSLIK